MHLERTVRLLPHQNDTHGIFIAVIKKVKSSQRPAGPIIDPSCTTNQAKKALKKAAKILGTFLQAEKKNIQTVADFFGIEIGSITPITWSNWMERSSFGKEKDLYFVSTQVENFLSSYQGKLCVHKAGVHAFHRIPTANGSLSAASSSSFGYEITDEGVQTLLPFIHTRIVPLDMEEFEDLLKTKQVWLKNASPQLQEILFEMEQEGSIICVLNDLEPVQTGDRDLFVIANRRHNSFSIHSSSAKLAKIKALMNELNVPIDDDDEEEEEEEEEEDKNGYDSSSDVGAQYEDEDDV
jgi:tRNA (cytosine34-C5)-methyltransferase